MRCGEDVNEGSQRKGMKSMEIILLFCIEAIMLIQMEMDGCLMQWNEDNVRQTTKQSNVSRIGWIGLILWKLDELWLILNSN